MSLMIGKACRVCSQRSGCDCYICKAVLVSTLSCIPWGFLSGNQTLGQTAQRLGHILRWCCSPSQLARAGNCLRWLLHWRLRASVWTLPSGISISKHRVLSSLPRPRVTAKRRSIVKSICRRALIAAWAGASWYWQWRFLTNSWYWGHKTLMSSILFVTTFALSNCRLSGWRPQERERVILVAPTPFIFMKEIWSGHQRLNIAGGNALSLCKWPMKDSTSRRCYTMANKGFASNLLMPKVRKVTRCFTSLSQVISVILPKWFLWLN